MSRQGFMGLCRIEENQISLSGFPLGRKGDGAFGDQILYNDEIPESKKLCGDSVHAGDGKYRTNCIKFRSGCQKGQNPHSEGGHL